MNEHQRQKARERWRRWYLAHREQEVERVTQWREENPEKVEATYRRYRDRHRDERITRSLRFQYEDAGGLSDEEVRARFDWAFKQEEDS